MMRRNTFALVTALIILFSLPVFAGKDDKYFNRFIEPLHAEAGPLLSPPLGSIPQTEIWAGFGLKYHDWQNGRAKYSQVSTRLIIGGQWSPKKLSWLGVGGDLVALQTNTVRTRLPPVIDEKDRHVNLGVLRLHIRARVFSIKKKNPKKLPIVLALTPFFRMGLPTDTSRIGQDRRMPMRYMLDSDVLENPYFLVEPGVAAGFLFWRINIYTHQSLMAAPVKNGEAYWFYSFHNGIAARIADMFELIFELNGLMRLTENDQGDRLSAWAASPGLRFIHGNFSYELSARLGYGKDPLQPYGKFTAACSISWTPDTD